MGSIVRKCFISIAKKTHRSLLLRGQVNGAGAARQPPCWGLGHVYTCNIYAEGRALSRWHENTTSARSAVHTSAYGSVTYVAQGGGLFTALSNINYADGGGRADIALD